VAAKECRLEVYIGSNVFEIRTCLGGLCRCILSWMLTSIHKT